MLNMRQFTTEEINSIVNSHNNGESLSRKNSIFYRGILGTIDSDIIISMTFDEKVEYSKCYSDIFYFIEIHCNIKLRNYQRIWIDNFINNRFNIYCISRQTGFNKIISSIYLHYLIFNKNKTILSLSNRSETSIEFLDILFTLYKSIPYYLKTGLISKNSKSIKFSNGNKIISSTAKNPSIGCTIDILQYLEFANIHSIDNNYRMLIPTVSSNKDSKIVIQSQPNGCNLFYKLVNDSERKDGDPLKNFYKTTKTYWWEVEGRDENWKQEEIRRIGGIDAFNREYDIQFILNPYRII